MFFTVVTVNTLCLFMGYFILKFFVKCVSTKLKTKTLMLATSSGVCFLLCNFHCMLPNPIILSNFLLVLAY